MNKKYLTALKINAEKPLILDGAFGSYFQNQFIDETDILWASRLNLTDREKVKELHELYIKAGADIITTNTFRTNPYAIRLSNQKINSRKIVQTAVDIAIEARAEKDIIIAGCNAPAEDCYRKERTISLSELRDNHFKHIEYLWNSGCDFVWNETFSHLDEIEIVSDFCHKNKIPFIINLFFNANLNLLSGENLGEAIELIKQFNPIAIGFNCIAPSVLEKVFQAYRIDFSWGFYLNCGSGNHSDNKITCSVSPLEYWNYAEKYLKYSPLYIGSCCGSSPAHTKYLKEKLDEIN